MLYLYFTSKAYFFILIKKIAMKLILKLLFIIINFSLLLAQTDSYNISEYNTSEGLSQSVVHTVIQDSRGFIWCGTQDGLNRFDGEHFKIYRYNPLDSNSISHGYIWIIVEDSDSNLWIGTYGGGLDYYKYNTDSFENYKYIEEKNSINGNDVRAIYEDKDGMIWIGTENGLNVFNKKTKRWKNLSNGNNSAVPYNNIRDIHPYKEIGLWLSAYGDGLVFYDLNQNKSYLYSFSNLDSSALSSNDVWEVYKDRENVYWVLTFGGGLNLFNSEKFSPFGEIKFDHFLSNAIDKDLTSIYEMPNGEVFIGTDTDGLVIIDSLRQNYQKLTVDPNSTNTITNNGIWDIMQDNQGNIWLGTFGGGLNYLQRSEDKFRNISTKSGPVKLNNPIVFVVRKIAKNKLIAGTYGGGLSLLDRKNGSVSYYTESNSGVASNYITDIVIENDSSYWFGTDGKGVSNYNPANNSFTNYNTQNYNKLQSDFVKCMLIDSFNNIWVGSLGGLCNIKQPEKTRNKNYYNFSYDVDTRSLFELKPGVILIGTHGDGLFQHDIHEGTLTKIENDLIRNEQITQIYSADAKIIWLGTRGSGLIKYDIEADSVDLFTELDGLCNNTILGITKDDYERLWITTNDGISVFDITRNKFINYYTVDGLLSNEFVQGSIYKDDNGIIYAGSVSGIEIIDPNKFSVSNFNPPIEITGITVLNKEVSPKEYIDDELNLSYNENFVKINFASLDYTNPTKNQYRYKIGPGHEEWINLGNEGAVNFANLPSDNYLIELNGSNSDGIWSKNVRKINLTINPPFYSTYWFYAVVLFTIGFVIYRFYYLRIQKRLEMDKLRLKIAKDLHDDVGSSLSQISLNADMINYESNLSKIKNRSELIRSKSSEMINTMNDVIWSIDSRKDNLESLVERLKTMASQFTSSKQMILDFRDKISNPKKKLDVNFRQNIFLIVKEAVNNAVKYSNSEKITLNILESNERLHISISDFGKGLAETNYNKGNGLTNMKSRAKEINGEINFVNKNGLTVDLKVKIA